MTNVTRLVGETACQTWFDRWYHMAAQQFASHQAVGQSNDFHCYVAVEGVSVQGANPRSMRFLKFPSFFFNPRSQRFALHLFSGILLSLSPSIAQVVTPTLPNQVPTSAQNAIYGSVPEEKPTAGVLSLTFREAIERALRHNLTGLLTLRWAA